MKDIFLIILSIAVLDFIFISVNNSARIQGIKSQLTNLDKRVYKCESTLGFIEGELKHME